MVTLPPPSPDKNKPLIWGTKVDFGKKRRPPEYYLKICLEQHGKRAKKVSMCFSFPRFGRRWGTRGLAFIVADPSLLGPWRKGVRVRRDGL